MTWSGKVDAAYVALLERRMKRYRKLFEASGGVCAYCPTRLTYLVAPDGKLYPNSITRDHDVPRCKNGKKNGANVVAACYRCNMVKGKMTGDTFRRVIALHPDILTGAVKNFPDPEPRKKRRARHRRFGDGRGFDPVLATAGPLLPPTPHPMRRMLSTCTRLLSRARSATQQRPQ